MGLPFGTDPQLLICEVMNMSNYRDGWNGS